MIANRFLELAAYYHHAPVDQKKYTRVHALHLKAVISISNLVTPIHTCKCIYISCALIQKIIVESHKYGSNVKMTDCRFACMKFIYIMDTNSATRCWLHEYGANVKMTDCRFAWMKFTCQLADQGCRQCRETKRQKKTTRQMNMLTKSTKRQMNKLTKRGKKTS